MAEAGQKVRDPLTSYSTSEATAQHASASLLYPEMAGLLWRLVCKPLFFVLNNVLDNAPNPWFSGLVLISKKEPFRT